MPHPVSSEPKSNFYKCFVFNYWFPSFDTAQFPLKIADFVNECGIFSSRFFKSVISEFFCILAATTNSWGGHNNKLMGRSLNDSIFELIMFSVSKFCLKAATPFFRYII